MKLGKVEIVKLRLGSTIKTYPLKLSPLFRQGRELRTITGLIAVNNGAT